MLFFPEAHCPCLAKYLFTCWGGHSFPASAGFKVFPGEQQRPSPALAVQGLLITQVSCGNLHVPSLPTLPLQRLTWYSGRLTSAGRLFWGEINSNVGKKKLVASVQNGWCFLQLSWICFYFIFLSCYVFCPHWEFCHTAHPALTRIPAISPYLPVLIPPHPLGLWDQRRPSKSWSCEGEAL